MSENPYVSPDGESEKKKTRSWVGSLLWIGVGILLLLLLLPNLRFGGASRPAARRAQCMSNLRNIGLALHVYHQTYDAYPPAYTVDAQGKPLHSWRTLILPFLEEQALYDSIDLSKPWDDPANSKARETVVEIYRCPEAEESGNRTTYMAIVAPNSCFPLSKSREIDDITDGLKQTLLLIEVPAEQAVPWMAPQDASEKLFLSLYSDSHLPHHGAINVIFADAHLATITPESLSAEQRRALISVAGDDEVGDLDD